MHVEIQVALNFLISFLYNKLPRRRVNNFGEELEAALKVKFEGHWYPEKPFKGSAFRCVKTATPLDPVFAIAAREAGMDLCDIQENLPHELSIWIDPGEVSYRMSEKGPVKILYSETDAIDAASDREVAPTFNPEAQSFKPVDTMASQFSGLSLSSVMPAPHMNAFCQPLSSPVPHQPLKSSSSMTGFGPKPNNVTYTAAAFAQTKFGSTKLKTNSKRSQRMSPTEFGNYIKQKAMMQQSPSAIQPSVQYPPIGSSSTRSISPDSLDLFYQGLTSCPSPPNFSTFGLDLNSPSEVGRSRFLEDVFFGSESGFGSPIDKVRRESNEQEPPANMSRFASFMDKAGPFVTSPSSSVSSGVGLEAEAAASPASSADSANGFDGMNGSSYQNPYQHLLLAN